MTSSSDASGRTGPGPLSPALCAALTDLRLPGLRPDGVPDVWLADRRIPGDTAREVRLALATAMYERWHAATALEPDAPARLPRRDHAFEARLTAATPHAHTLSRRWCTPPRRAAAACSRWSWGGCG
ncbi:hypothetical protein SAZ11_52480 [Streptomyces sp. FXJ1.4098]|nr:hypothetical protein [Streptomyces sp. FXJ1.4098]